MFTLSYSNSEGLDLKYSVGICINESKKQTDYAEFTSSSLYFSVKTNFNSNTVNICKICPLLSVAGVSIESPGNDVL